MLFNSYAFLLAFLPSAIVICRLVDSYPGIRTWALILLSLVFYGYWNPSFVVILVGSILLNWTAARAFAATKNKLILTTAIVADLALLGLFKYANFLTDNLEILVGVPIRAWQLALPLGISFFTFHHIMYLVDLRRGRAPIFPLDRYALYICFFPQAIAGPIARWWQVMHQFGNEIFAAGWERRCALGVTFIVVGLIEKVFLADQLASILTPVFAQATTGPVSDGSAWLALGFGFQVFFDFAGYSDIAIGLALVFGIELPQNFNAPFQATSIQEFWQRWHMTLSLFLRDYVFVPLLDISLGAPRHRMSQYVAAIIVTMALCGLWHGAGWNFICWGVLHGCALASSALWRSYAPSPPAFVGRSATIMFHLITAVFIGAGTMPATMHIFGGLGRLPEPGLLARAWTLPIIGICAIVLPASQDLCLQLNKPPRPLVAGLLALVAVAILIQLGRDETYEFTYFQF
jgi:alginate O-acetyltransferase complex protein AlgI